MVRLGALLFVLGAIAVGVCGSADAAIVSGSSLAVQPELSICGAPSPGELRSCSMVNSVLPASTAAPGGARAAIDGVIVSWTVRTDTLLETTPVALLVVHGNNEARLGETETLSTGGVGLHTFGARTPVSKGDRLGLQMGEVEGLFSPAMVHPGVAGALLQLWNPVLQPGSPRAPAEEPELELMMNATIEPDADHDGYGDETQDQCPTQSGPGPCSPTPVQRPDTAITKGPTGKIHSRTAVFAFRSDPPGAEFECKLDKRKFKPCSTPRKYKHLGLGKHRFQVRAVNAAGSDSIPAARSFRITP